MYNCICIYYSSIFNEVKASNFKVGRLLWVSSRSIECLFTSFTLCRNKNVR